MFNDLENSSFGTVNTQNVKAYPSINSPNSGGFNDEINMKWISKKFIDKPFVIDSDTSFKKVSQAANNINITSGAVCIDGYMIRLAQAGKTSFDSDNNGTLSLNIQYVRRFVDDLTGNGTNKPMKCKPHEFLFDLYNPDNYTSDYDTLSSNWGTAAVNKICVGYICIVYTDSYYSALAISGSKVSYEDTEIPIKSYSGISYSSTPEEIKTAVLGDSMLGKAFAISSSGEMQIFYPLYSDLTFNDIFGIVFRFSSNLIDTKCYPYTDSVYIDTDSNAPLSVLSFTDCTLMTDPTYLYDFEELYNSSSVRYDYDTVDVSATTTYGSSPVSFPTSIFNVAPSDTDTTSIFFRYDLATLLSGYVPAHQTAITSVYNTLDYICLNLNGYSTYKAFCLDNQGSASGKIPVAFMTSNGALSPNGFISTGTSRSYPVEGYLHYAKRGYLLNEQDVVAPTESEINAVTLDQLCGSSWFRSFYTTVLAKAMSVYLQYAYCSIFDNVCKYNDALTSPDYMYMKSIGCGKKLNGTAGTEATDFTVNQEYSYTGYKYSSSTDTFDTISNTVTIQYQDDLTSDYAKLQTVIEDYPSYSNLDTIPFAVRLDKVDVSGTPTSIIDKALMPITIEDPIHYMKRCSIAGVSPLTIPSITLYKVNSSGAVVQCTKTISSSGGVVTNVQLDDALFPLQSQITIGDDDDCNTMLRTHGIQTNTGEGKLSSAQTGLCLCMSAYTWLASIPNILTITKDSLNYLAGKDFLNPNKYLGCTISYALSYDGSADKAMLFNMEVPTNLTTFTQDRESKFIEIDTESNSAKVGRDSYINVDRIYDPNGMLSIDGHIENYIGDLQNQIDNLTQIINTMQTRIASSQLTYYHDRVYIGNAEFGAGAPLPRVYGLQPNSKIAIKIGLYYVRDNIHWTIDDYAVQFYQITDAGTTYAHNKYNQKIKTEYYYSYYGGEMERYGIILIKNDSDDFIDDVVFDLQISRNLDSVYPSDANCDIKTVAAVVLDATTKTMSVSDTDTLTATIIKDADNTISQSIVWSSDNTAVATVDQSGNISAVSAGTATITAKCNYKITNNYVLTDVYATCKVTVS
jgi:uncharacterized protein YjdB